MKRLRVHKGEIVARARQLFGTAALLRSAAVMSSRRRSGLGGAIVQMLGQRAQAVHVTELFLLTQRRKRSSIAGGIA